MANHVSSYLRFERISDAGVKKLNEIYERFQDKKVAHLAYCFVDDIDNLNSDERIDVLDRIGAKWAYVEDFDDTGMSFESAWSQVTPFVEYVIETIAEVDNNLLAIYTYQDECPNFIGVDVYTSEGMYDGVEIDDTEITEIMMAKYSDIAEQWDSEEEEWKDDGETYYDRIWEFVNEWQEDMIQAITEDL